MIFTSSVIDGFKVILGSLPIQLGMFMTTLCMVPVPNDPKTGEQDREALYTYIWLCIVHFILFVQITINHYVL